MKNKLKTIAFYTLALILGGCVQSIYPLFGENEFIFDPNMVGLWKTKDSNETWQFSREAQNNNYDLVITQPDGKKGDFLACLGELQNNLFLDIYPKESKSQESDFYKQHLISSHSFIKIEQIEPTLKIAMMNYDNVKKILEADPNILKHEFANDRLILTAKTEDLQQFVVEYGTNVDEANSIFGEAGGLIWIAEDANDNTTADQNN
jgi:hypothetical protein